MRNGRARGLLAMQKVEGSSPFSRSEKRPANAGLFSLGASRRRTRWTPAAALVRKLSGRRARVLGLKKRPRLVARAAQASSSALARACTGASTVVQDVV